MTASRQGVPENLWMANLTHSSGGNYTAAFLGFLEGFKDCHGKGRHARKSQSEGIPHSMPDGCDPEACLLSIVSSFLLHRLSPFKLCIWPTGWKHLGMKGREDFSWPLGLMMGFIIHYLFCTSRGFSDQEQPFTLEGHRSLGGGLLSLLLISFQSYHLP